MEYYICIDFGGTNTKVILYTADGKQCKNESFKTEILQVGENYREINLYTLRENIFSAIRKCSDAIEDSNMIVGVACIGHGKGLYLLDKDKKIFTNGILSTDERAISSAKQFQDKIAEIYPITHQQIMPSQAPILLRWLKDNEPQIYGNIGYILSAKDFIRFLLTNEIYQEIQDASGNNLLNLSSRNYDDRLLAFFGIEEMRDCLPSLVSYCDICGTVHKTVSLLTNLAEGTPVIGGFFDIDACTLGAGVIDDTYLHVIAGTWNINVIVKNEPSVAGASIMNSIYLDRFFLQEASSPTSAGNLDVFNKMFGIQGIDYKQINTMVEDESSKSGIVFYPFLYGFQGNGNTTGMFLGLKSAHEQKHIYRAIYEGVVFAHKYHILQLFSSMKSHPKKIRISGGVVNSRAWLQIFADILQMEIEVIDEPELGCLGGVIALNMVFQQKELTPQMLERFVKVKDTIKPTKQSLKYYEEKYQKYIQYL